MAEGGDAWCFSSLFYLLTGRKSGKNIEKHKAKCQDRKVKILQRLEKKKDAGALKQLRQAVGEVMKKEEFLKEAVQIIGYSSNALEINAVQNKRKNISEPWVSDLAKISCAFWNDLKNFVFNLYVRDCSLNAT